MKTKGTRRTKGREHGKKRGGCPAGSLYCVIYLVFGAMVGWLSNTLYRIGPGSKPGACVSGRDDAQSGVYHEFGSTVGGVLEALSW